MLTDFLTKRNWKKSLQIFNYIFSNLAKTKLNVFENLQNRTMPCCISAKALTLQRKIFYFIWATGFWLETELRTLLRFKL